MSIGVAANYAFPFRIDTATGGTAQATYADHIDQMIRQTLLTDPGERVDLPTFGCGVRAMVFQSLSPALVASGQILVQQALNQWLAGIIQVTGVAVATGSDAGGLVEPASIIITIDYVIIETQGARSTAVELI